METKKIEDLRHFRRSSAFIYPTKDDRISDERFQSRYGPNFNLEELADKRTGLIVLDDRAMGLLAKTREHADIPFILNSATRSQETNRMVGGHPNSAHMVGRAFDIRVADGWQAYRIVRVAMGLGWCGIGIKRPSGGKGYVHLDDVDRGEKGPVVWTYP